MNLYKENMKKKDKKEPLEADAFPFSMRLRFLFFDDAEENLIRTRHKDLAQNYKAATDNPISFFLPYSPRHHVKKSHRIKSR